MFCHISKVMCFFIPCSASRTANGEAGEYNRLESELFTMRKPDILGGTRRDRHKDDRNSFLDILQ